MDLTYGIKGEYEVIVLRDNNPHIHYKFKNLLLDTFFTQWSQSSPTLSLMCNCFVGSGTTPPQVTDTQLESFVAQAPTSASLSSYNSKEKIGSDYWAHSDLTFTFNPGQIISALGEIGIQMNTQSVSHTKINSRALIKDSNGNPVVLQLTATDQLIVKYRLSIKIPSTPSVGVFTISGVSTTVTMESLNVMQTEPWNAFHLLQQSVTAPGASGANFATATLRNNPESAAPSPTNGAMTPINITTANIGPGIREHTFTIPVSSNPTTGSTFSYLILNAAGYQSSYRPAFGIHFNPAVSKTNEEIYTITYRMVATRL